MLAKFMIEIIFLHPKLFQQIVSCFMSCSLATLWKSFDWYCMSEGTLMSLRLSPLYTIIGFSLLSHVKKIFNAMSKNLISGQSLHRKGPWIQTIHPVLMQIANSYQRLEILNSCPKDLHIALLHCLKISSSTVCRHSSPAFQLFHSYRQSSIPWELNEQVAEVGPWYSRNQLPWDSSVTLSKYNKCQRCHEQWLVPLCVVHGWRKKFPNEVCTMSISRPAIKSTIVLANFWNVSSWQPHLLVISESSVYCLSRCAAQRKWTGSAPFQIQSSSCLCNSIPCHIYAKLDGSIKKTLVQHQWKWLSLTDPFLCMISLPSILSSSGVANMALLECIDHFDEASCLSSLTISFFFFLSVDSLTIIRWCDYKGRVHWRSFIHFAKRRTNFARQNILFLHQLSTINVISNNEYWAWAAALRPCSW